MLLSRFMGPFFTWFSHSNPLESSIASAKAIAKVWDEEGPFDGLLGFSDGAAMCQIFLYWLSKCKIELKSPVKFLILVALPVLCFPEIINVSREPYLIHTPSLHIVGDSDHVFEESLRLISNFYRPSLLVHSLAH